MKLCLSHLPLQPYRYCWCCSSLPASRSRFGSSPRTRQATPDSRPAASAHSPAYSPRRWKTAAPLEPVEGLEWETAEAMGRHCTPARRAPCSRVRLPPARSPCRWSKSPRAGNCNMPAIADTPPRRPPLRHRRNREGWRHWDRHWTTHPPRRRSIPVQVARPRLER